MANFLQSVADRHYDGTIFHRVIDKFKIQGGGFDANHVERGTRAPIAHDKAARHWPVAAHRNVVGTIAMARTNDPNSATTQFFINVRDNAFLDPVPIPPGDPVPRFEYQGRVYENMPRERLVNAPQLFGYVAFGKVVSGLDVVMKIKSVPTAGAEPFGQDVPRKPVIIHSATLVK